MLKLPILHPQILSALGSAGHLATVLISDGNYPHNTKPNPRAPIVYANFRPGLISATDALQIVCDLVPIEKAEVMAPDVLAAVTPPGDDSVEDAALTSQAVDAVGRALRQLPEEQSRALLLAAFFGRTAEEISRAEAIPLGTAKTRIRLGLRRIRAQLTTPAEEA